MADRKRSSATREPSMKYSIVLSTQPAQFQAATFKGDLETNLEKIASYGYAGVELAIRDPNLIDFDRITTLLTKNGLEVPAIGTGQAWGEEGLSFTDPDPSVRQEAVKRIMNHIHGAAQFNAIIIIGLIRGVVKKDVDPKIAMQWLVESLRECSDASSKFGVRLALEPINRYETSLINSVADGVNLVKEVGAENFGLLLDTFHMNIEEPNMGESIRVCADRIFHFHVADSNRWPPGAGHLDFRSILVDLAACGYHGWVSGEFLPLPDAETAAKRGIEHLQGMNFA